MKVAYHTDTSNPKTCPKPQDAKTSIHVNLRHLKVGIREQCQQGQQHVLAFGSLCYLKHTNCGFIQYQLHCSAGKGKEYYARNVCCYSGTRTNHPGCPGMKTEFPRSPYRNGYPLQKQMNFQYGYFLFCFGTTRDLYMLA